MNRILFFLSFVLILGVQDLRSQVKYQWKEAASAGYKYKYVSNDPAKTRFYTLPNGLTVILTPNSREPRVTMRIAVRSGSTNDPSDHTGLAHYLEHLLFKGTDKYGSLDWSKEKPYIDQIERLYEQYNSTADTGKRKAIYREIDSVSGVASKYAIAGEYDKMVSALGSQGTNAHTWLDETVYKEDIPSNAIEPLMKLQAERFRAPVFRIFHTELEAVYEEKNRGLDNDNSKMQEAMFELLFPGHKYGTQTTIGTIEHLKNPSITAIRNYYNKYYVPNNIAIILAGDLNPDQVIKIIDRNFSYMKKQPVETYQGPKLAPVNTLIAKEIYGPSAENVRMVFRGAGAGTRDAMLASLATSVLYNQVAGLIDLNINQQQKVLGAGAALWQFREAGLLFLFATPKAGQSLDEAKSIVMDQVNMLKRGEFDEKLITAIVANKKLAYLQSLKNNTRRAEELTNEFINSRGENWNLQVAMLDEMSKVTKKELTDFAKQFFGDNNYAVIYKRKGKDNGIVKVEKPPITPVETNAGKVSPFAAAIINEKLKDIKPVWVNYDEKIRKTKAGIADELYVQNKEDKLFQLTYRFPFGKWSDKKLDVAADFLEYIGTPSLSREQINKRLYELASQYSLSVRDQETTLTISGLQENFGKAVALVEGLLNNCTGDDETLNGLKSILLKSRADAKLNKGAIAGALQSYALYGAKNPFNNVLSEAEINALSAKELTGLLHELKNHKHLVAYYGPLSEKEFNTQLSSLHKLPAGWSAAPAALTFKKQQVDKNSVLFANYDMVQAEIFWARGAGEFNVDDEARVSLFNEYFGGGMGSIVFSTIRESKALAYSTYARIAIPSRKNDEYSFIGYVGAQADKVNEAIGGMNDLLNALPRLEDMFGNAKLNILKSIATDRINDDQLIGRYLAAKEKGLDEDIRERQYTQFQKMTLDDLTTFHKEKLSGKPYTYCVIASDQKIQPQSLEKYGTVKIMTLTELFGY